MAARSEKFDQIRRTVLASVRPLGFEGEGACFRLRAENGNGIGIEFQVTTIPATAGNGDGPGRNFYINVGMVLSPHMEWLGDPWSANDWRPNIIDTVFLERLGPDGWDGMYIWRMSDAMDVEVQAAPIVAALQNQLPDLMRLLEPEAMVAASKSERWPRAGVVQGFVLADRGDVPGVRKHVKDGYREPTLIEKGMIELARNRSVRGRRAMARRDRLPTAKDGSE
jgi:hypothetical protein